MDQKFFFEEEKRWVNLRVSASGMRIITKKGLKVALKEAKDKGFIANY
jgi:large subunit ribosomal protein L28